VKLDGIGIHDFRIIERNGKPFVEVPQITRKVNGQIFFNPVITFPEELMVRVETVILTAFFGAKEKTHGTKT